MQASAPIQSAPMVDVQHMTLIVEGQQAVWLTAPQCIRQEVAGEAYNTEQVNGLVRLMGGHLGVPLVAWLAPEPANLHDPKSVMVWIKGGRVGYLPRGEASSWHMCISDLQRQYGLPIACAAHAELPPEDSSDISLQIVLWLPPLPWQKSMVYGQTIAAAMAEAATEPISRPVRAEQRRREEEESRRNAADKVRRRREELVTRFGVEATERILRREMWQGQTEDMLIEARGAPAEKESKVLKTKSKATFKYGWEGAKRYRLRVFLENGVVVGWEEKP